MGLFTFKTFSQNVAIELEKMNVFYKSVDNPIKVVVQDYPCNKIILKAKYGIIKHATDSCHYIYRTDSCYEYRENIYVGVISGNTTKWIDTLKYKLKKIPDGVIYVANRTGGIIDRKTLLASEYSIYGMADCNVELNFEVIQYSVEIKRNDSTIFKQHDIKGYKFSDELKNEIKKSQTGDRYLFFDVILKTFDKCSDKIMGPMLTIE